MKKLWSYVKNHRIVSSLIFLFLILGVPLLINQSYKCENCILQTAWKAEDVLSYYGSVLSLIGTLLVSMLALEQTYELDKKSSDEQKKNYKRPYLSIVKVLYNKREIHFERNSWSFNCDKLSHVKIYLKNDGDGIAKKCFYKDYFRREGEDIDKYKMNIDIAVGDIYPLTISLNKNKKQYEITYENIIDQKYEKLFGVRITEEIEQMESDDIKTHYKVEIFNIN